jgi:hypothetical protein
LKDNNQSTSTSKGRELNSRLLCLWAVFGQVK